MKVLLTTTGALSPVDIEDLNGVSFTHPTSEFDLLLEFTLEELYESIDLFARIDDGSITLKDNLGRFITTDSQLSSVSDSYVGGASGISDQLMLLGG
jgi:hypothetical protein